MTYDDAVVKANIAFTIYRQDIYLLQNRHNPNIYFVWTKSLIPGLEWKGTLEHYLNTNWKLVWYRSQRLHYKREMFIHWGIPYNRAEREQSNDKVKQTSSKKSTRKT